MTLPWQQKRGGSPCRQWYFLMRQWHQTQTLLLGAKASLFTPCSILSQDDDFKQQYNTLQRVLTNVLVPITAKICALQ